MTIVGFKRIFEQVTRYIEAELPERIDRLARMTLKISYEIQSDTLVMRTEDSEPAVPIFELLAPNIYLEKRVPSKDVVGAARGRNDARNNRRHALRGVAPA